MRNKRDNKYVFKISLLGFIAVFAQNILFSQNYKGGPNYNDLQLWQNIYIEKKLNHKFSVHLNEEGRITENITLPSYIYTDFGLTYKFRKYLRFTIAYVPIAKRLQTDFVAYNHQFYIDFVLKLKWQHFIFYERQMFQWQYNDINSSATWNVPSNYLRNKVTIKYNPDSRYTPYIAAEYYYHDNYNQYNGTQGDRMRYYAGCFYELNKVNQVELYYLVEPHYNIPAPFTNFIIGIGYSHNLY